jgi:hypothetical protein
VEEKVTYHDQCFLGRHNKVYTPARAIIDAVPGTTAEEIHRCKGKGFCCGAGGAHERSVDALMTVLGEHGVTLVSGNTEAYYFDNGIESLASASPWRAMKGA